MDHNQLRKLAGIVTESSFDTQVHPEDSAQSTQYDSQAEYEQINNEVMQGVQQVIEQIATKYGWKPLDVLSLAADGLRNYYENQ